MDNKLIEFAKEQCKIFPEDSYMGKYLRETLKMLQAEPFEDAKPYEKFESAKDHIYKLAGDYKCWDNRLTHDEALELCKVLEQESIIDKKIAEIEMEKHTDRQIYDGCIHLIQNMVDYFQEYLDYLGYDLDKLDKDERFAVEMSNMEIVRWLFLLNTRNSGGCSTRDFCEQLGVDPYKSVKFEFERGGE